ncbi:MAG: hypothetical protein LBD11_07710 [Candidatus Peribacteria bacterium]|nr:hypothetical protein [Candidatus Peribacteria bacterium]
METLKNSDFFPCLIKIVEMERKNTDTTLPKLQNIQAVERVLLRLVGYYADTGDLSTAVDLNILALKLGDKYLSTYSSLVQGLIAIVGTNLATAGTEYLINHHELNTEDRARILETYKNILTTEKETAIRNIFKGEYTAMSEMVRDFDFKSPDEINTIGVNIEPPYLDIY